MLSIAIVIEESQFFLFAVHHKREEEFSDRLRPNANCKGCTALHYAALVDDEKIIKTLLDAGTMFDMHSHVITGAGG